MKLNDPSTYDTEIQLPALRGAYHPQRASRGADAPRRPADRRSPLRRALTRLIRWGLAALVVGVLAVALVGWAYLASLPSVGDAQARVAAILQAHHAQAAGLPPPQKVGAAVVAVEDHRFYSDHGLDILSVLHGAWGYLTTGSTQVAGATLSEQLVKILYVREPQTLGGKLEMMGLALKLNASYAKPQILAMYLNAIYYGHNAYGVAQASQTYFHAAPDQLTWGQASLLAGLPQAPTDYDPLAHYALARLRQRHVLARLVADGVLTPAQATQAYNDTTLAP